MRELIEKSGSFLCCLTYIFASSCCGYQYYPMNQPMIAAFTHRYQKLLVRPQQGVMNAAVCCYVM